MLLHIVFYAKLGSEEAAFDIADVAHDICEKLIHQKCQICKCEICETLNSRKMPGLKVSNLSKTNLIIKVASVKFVN